MDSMEEAKKDVALTPQYHAERCVVCNGFGTLKHGTKECQGCKGKGYILVPNFIKDGETEGGENENSR